MERDESLTDSHTAPRARRQANKHGGFISRRALPQPSDPSPFFLSVDKRHTTCIHLNMAQYQWDPAKNEWLLRHRSISFEEILWHIAEGHLLDVLVSDKERYKGQKQFVVDVRGYAYLVPFVEEGDAIVLKTIIPNRKLTKRYLRRGGTE